MSDTLADLNKPRIPMTYADALALAIHIRKLPWDHEAAKLLMDLEQEARRVGVEDERNAR